MNEDFAGDLCRLNDRFYANQSASFSATRASSWEGWGRVAEAMRSSFGTDGDATSRAGGVLHAGGDGVCRAPSADGDGGASGSGCTPSVGDNGVGHASDASACLPDGVGAATGGAPGAGNAVAPDPLRVLDVACGNLRFERFLPHTFPRREVRFVAVDTCEALLPDELPGGVTFRHVDVMARLQRMDGRQRSRAAACAEGGRPAGPPCGGDSCDCDSAAGLVGASDPCSAGVSVAKGCATERGGFDAAVCFGFMHHVPLLSWRLRLLDCLINAVRPGGLVVVSLWRFADNGYLAEKARRTTAEACVHLGWDAADLDEGDYLLGWQDRPGVYRYCHSFTDKEVDALVQHATGGMSDVGDSSLAVDGSEPAAPVADSAAFTSGDSSRFAVDDSGRRSSVADLVADGPAPAISADLVAEGSAPTISAADGSAFPIPVADSPAPTVPADLVARFRADGRTHDLNEYLILQRR